MMKSGCLAALAAAVLAPVYAQEKPAVKIVEIKYADPLAIEQMLRMFSCNIQRTEPLRTLSLRCPEDQMNAVEDAIRRFDVPAAPPKDIDLTAWLLVASEKPEPAGTPVPPELEPVVKQVRAVFAYKNFSLLDALQMRAGSGQSAEATGRIGSLFSRFWIQRWSLRDNVVSIDNLQAGLRIPTARESGKVSYEFNGVSLGRIDLPVGQRVVVGKSSMEGPGKALVVVLSAAVL